MIPHVIQHIYPSNDIINDNIYIYTKIDSIQNTRFD